MLPKEQTKNFSLENGLKLQPNPREKLRDRGCEGRVGDNSNINDY